MAAGTIRYWAAAKAAAARSGGAVRGGDRRGGAGRGAHAAAGIAGGRVHGLRQPGGAPRPRGGRRRADGLRVASYDYPSRFVHMTAGVALPLTVAAPAVYLIGRALV
ncbi:hypothetical protein SMICM304S_11179 [Streptomyces microflavus]